jgi:hypothetical protein
MMEQNCLLNGGQEAERYTKESRKRYIPEGYNSSDLLPLTRSSDYEPVSGLIH